MDLQGLYDRLHRDPEAFPLFERIWEVLSYAPSSKHADTEQLVSLACDALDYLEAGGKWATSSTQGRTELFWDGNQLNVYEDDDSDFRYEHAFTIH